MEEENMQPAAAQPRCECNATTDQLCEVCTAHRGLPAQPKGDAQQGVVCEPQRAVTSDGWTDWICPKPVGYLMQCCDCGLVHEVDSRVAHYKPRPSEEYSVVDDPDMQAQWRMRRRDDLAATAQASEPSAASTDDRAQACRIAAEADKYLRYNRTHLGQLIYVSDLVWALVVLSRAAPARAVEPLTHWVVMAPCGEGVVFVDGTDAEWTATGKGGSFGKPAIGEAFRECYGHETLTLHHIGITTTPAAKEQS